MQAIDDVGRHLRLIAEQDHRASDALIERGDAAAQRCALALREIRIDDHTLAVVADRGRDAIGLVAEHQIQLERAGIGWHSGERCPGSGDHRDAVVALAGPSVWTVPRPARFRPPASRRWPDRLARTVECRSRRDTAPDRAAGLRQRSAGAAVADGDDLGQDRNRHLVRCVGADIETDRAADPRDALGGDARVGEALAPVPVRPPAADCPDIACCRSPGRRSARAHRTLGSWVRIAT